ncbi:hypothetical protein CU097_005116 [Rhizopus azygosporus]|uniref:Uncharacterized protein n=1 Tax=Rhizopus azygosporus TaxID=86630 RepID=A0A367K313_RHIAZ|nr:hypothetical protein CU097_005116 [Rhizopus azygosporus]
MIPFLSDQGRNIALQWTRSSSYEKESDIQSDFGEANPGNNNNQALTLHRAIFWQRISSSITVIASNSNRLLFDSILPSLPPPPLPNATILTFTSAAPLVQPPQAPS